MSQIVLTLIAGLIVEQTGMNQMYMVISSVCGFASAYSANSISFTASDAESIKDRVSHNSWK